METSFRTFTVTLWGPYFREQQRTLNVENTMETFRRNPSENVFHKSPCILFFRDHSGLFGEIKQ